MRKVVARGARNLSVVPGWVYLVVTFATGAVLLGGLVFVPRIVGGDQMQRMQVKPLIVMVDIEPTTELYQPSAELRRLYSEGKGSKVLESAISRTQSVEELAALRAGLLVPSYVPDGFTFWQGLTLGDNTSHLNYRKGQHSKFVGLTISQSYVEPGLQIKWRVAPGSYEPITVSGQAGYLIRGSWLDSPRPDGLRLKEWAEHIQTKVMFEGPDNQVIDVTVNPGRGLDVDTLLRIAESLQPY